MKVVTFHLFITRLVISEAVVIPFRQCPPVNNTFPLSSSKGRVPAVSISPANSSSKLGSFWNCLLGQEAGEHFSCLESLPLQLQPLPSESCSASTPPITHLEESSLTTSPPLVSVLPLGCGTCALWADMAFLNVLPSTCGALIILLSASCGNCLSPWKQLYFSLITSLTHVRMQLFSYMATRHACL